MYDIGTHWRQDVMTSFLAMLVIAMRTMTLMTAVIVQVHHVTQVREVDRLVMICDVFEQT